MLTDKDTVLATLNQTLTSCSELIEAGDYSNSQQSTEHLANFLNSISESLVVVASDRENEDSESIAIELLSRIRHYIASPELNQDVIDALAFELPKAVARFACVSSRCVEVAEIVVDQFVQRCSPRDMLSILCEALGSAIELFMVPSYFIPLLSGLMKVLILIQRRHYEQVKTVVPVIINALKTISSKSDEEDPDYEKLFQKATGVANSIREVCGKLEGKDFQKLRALLSLYVLQIMALVSVGLISDMSRCLPVVRELSGFLQYCKLSYIGLVTGCEVDVISKLVFGDDSNGDMGCFSQVNLGAALMVLWGYKSSEVAMVAQADLTAVIMELQGNWTRRWEAIGMLKFIFSCANIPWELKKHGLKFLLCIMDGIVSHTFNDDVDFSNLYTSLQAFQMLIIYAADSASRKDAFKTFKMVLADLPRSVRFDVLRALIVNSDSSSMIGILLDCVKEQMIMEKTERNSLPSVDLNTDIQYSPFWDPSVLELVEIVLRPPKGGPPSLPEYSDAVLSALNLYRYILITESTGNSNSTGVLSKDNLQKAYKEWFLPLRALVAGTVAENQKDHDQLTSDTIMCALNPLELVLYRCIELVEEKLKQL